MPNRFPATFDSPAIAYIEARLWHADDARHWPRVVLLTYRLVRGQLGLSPPPALAAVGQAARAAIAWAPAKNDPKTTRRELHAFYRVVARQHDASFNPDAVGDAEFDYWRIHREIAGETDRGPLVATLARIPTLLYDVPEARLIPSATERERAMRLVDAITSGRQAPTDAAWREIVDALVRSYEQLRAEIDAYRAKDARTESARDESD